jgi:hypothetical protein
VKRGPGFQFFCVFLLEALSGKSGAGTVYESKNNKGILKNAAKNGSFFWRSDAVTAVI